MSCRFRNSLAWPRWWRSSACVSPAEARITPHDSASVVNPSGPAGSPNASPPAAILARTARRYRGCDRFTRHYVASKLSRDPVHADVLALAAHEPFGQVIDLGCGRAQLGVALLEAGLADSVLGLDRRPGALAQARRAAAGLSFRAEARDLAAQGHLDAADTVMLIDVLYQLDWAAQAALLRQAAAVARCRVVLRMPDPDRVWRYRLTRGLERLFRRVWPTGGAHVNHLSLQQVVATLAESGFATESAPCSRGTPFANILVVARRRRDKI